MTPVQEAPAHTSPAPTAPADVMEAARPRVRDDMTVEVALSLMTGAGVESLLLCDGDDQCTGSVTRAALDGVRASSAYTDRVRLRDVLADPSAPAPPGLLPDSL